MSRKTANVIELESLLSDFVSPHLKAAGFHKSSHSFRRREANGDEARIFFRAFALGQLCSFRFDVEAAVEPFWDFIHFDRDRARAYPKRISDGDASFGRRMQPPTPDDPWPLWGSDIWGFEDLGQREQTGKTLEAVLLDQVLPDLRVILDRDALMTAAKRNQRLLGEPLWPDSVRILTVSLGPSEELDAILLGLDLTDRRDQKLAAWAAARVLDGPVWAQMLAVNVEVEIE